jgi:hypothetical protein
LDTSAFADVPSNKSVKTFGVCLQLISAISLASIFFRPFNISAKKVQADGLNSKEFSLLDALTRFSHQKPKIVRIPG